MEYGYKIVVENKLGSACQRAYLLKCIIKGGEPSGFKRRAVSCIPVEAWDLEYIQAHSNENYERTYFAGVLRNRLHGWGCISQTPCWKVIRRSGRKFFFGVSSVWRGNSRYCEYSMGVEATGQAKHRDYYNGGIWYFATKREALHWC
jgi:hypothetical protein